MDHDPSDRPRANSVLRATDPRTPRSWVGTSLALALLTSVLSLVPAAAVVGRDRPGDQMLQTYLDEQLAGSPIPGLAVAVTRGAELLHLSGHGSATGDASMTPDTPMRVASLSKSFTAVAVLQLVERGQVELDAPVQRYLPTFSLADDAAAARITVRQLLHHTTGLADRGFPDLWVLDQVDAEQRVTDLASARPVTEPGHRHSYFNPNYEVLARLVEVVSERSFGDHLEEHIFEPLGMTDTTSVTRSEHAEVAAPGLAQGHVVVFGMPVAWAEPDGFVEGSAGVVTTATDLARWLTAHTTGEGPDGAPFLDPDSLALAHEPPDGMDTEYAMGWWTATSGGHPVVEHNGVLATTYAEQILLPETGHGIVLLANANHALTDVARLKHGVVALVTGTETAGAAITHRRIAALIGGLLLLGLVVHGHGFLRRDVWARRRADDPQWRRYLGIVRLALPAVLLVALPMVIDRAAGRAFPHRLLALSMPEIYLWLAVATVTGLALATARIRALTRLRSRRALPSPSRR